MPQLEQFYRPNYAQSLIIESLEDHLDNEADDFADFTASDIVRDCQNILSSYGLRRAVYIPSELLARKYGKKSHYRSIAVSLSLGIVGTLGFDNDRQGYNLASYITLRDNFGPSSGIVRGVRSEYVLRKMVKIMPTVDHYPGMQTIEELLYRYNEIAAGSTTAEAGCDALNIGMYLSHQARRADVEWRNKQMTEYFETIHEPIFDEGGY